MALATGDVESIFHARNRRLVPQIAIELSWSLKLPTDGMAIPRIKNEKRCLIRGIAMPSVGIIGLKTQDLIRRQSAIVPVEGYF